ncbi:MAG: TatD family hydrolase, partial [Lachnospiraceae bacterium]|nr:TatD family hydrolase [Lachnospiraceae bacterium]
QNFLASSEAKRRRPEELLGSLAQVRRDGILFHDYLFTGREREIFDHTLGILMKAAEHPKVVAIGEIGLDYHWHQDDLPAQKAWFAAQTIAARELGLPLVIHSRDAAQDTFELLEGLDAGSIGGVMHCYSYKWEMALEYVKRGFFIGIGGSSTYGRAKHKKGKLYQVIREVPLSNIVLETDAPYQTPESHRGERNDSSLLFEVADYIAEIKGCKASEVVAATRDNALRLYPKMH